MNRFMLAATLLAAACWTGCGNDPGADPNAVNLDIELVFEGAAGGHVEVYTEDGTLDPCDDTLPCQYTIKDTGAQLTAVEDAGSTFVGWSGDCRGSQATFDLDAAAGTSKTCTATFAVTGAAGPPREGILVGNSQNCVPVAGPGFNCNVAAGGSFNVNAPSPTLDAALQTSNEFCYSYVDVTDFSSDDNGDVGLTTSLIDATATWSGGHYNFTGAATPFADTDSLAITTTGGTVNVAAPPLITLVDDPTNGLEVTTTGTADTIRLMAFGEDANQNSFGVICRFPFDAAAKVSNPDFVSAIDALSGGTVPYTVYAGISNQEDIVGWDDETRVGEAVRWFQLDGATLDAMGELQ